MELIKCASLRPALLSLDSSLWPAAVTGERLRVLPGWIGARGQLWTDVKVSDDETGKQRASPSN